MNRVLILEDGTVFKGIGFGSNKDCIAELVFNTSMVGYQEIMSDPSYTGQVVCMTYPLIGNYGLADDDYETNKPSITGMIVREYNDIPSNFRATATLDDKFKEFNVVGISEIDTRKLTRIIRDKGSMKVMITNEAEDYSIKVKEIKETILPTNQVAQVSTKKIWKSFTNNAKYNIVAIDCGIKLNIVRSFNKRGCNVFVVPYDITPKEIMELEPDGLFISNGPGDPENVVEVISTIKELQGKLPVFGICLGHQIIALANGCSTYKMKFGHRGGNHPVKRLSNGLIEITSQNHSYAVDTLSAEKSKLDITHMNILDNTVEGLESAKENLFSVQYHPESAPGPQDSSYLFNIFISNIEKFKAGEK